MRIGVDYVSSEDIRAGKTDHVKILGREDYVPKGGIKMKAVQVAVAKPVEPGVEKPVITKAVVPGTPLPEAPKAVVHEVKATPVIGLKTRE